MNRSSIWRFKRFADFGLLCSYCPTYITGLNHSHLLLQNKNLSNLPMTQMVSTDLTGRFRPVLQRGGPTWASLALLERQA